MEEIFRKQLIEAWETNNRINLFLIDRISEEGMKCTLSKRGGRNVVRQLAHLHNVRIYHLEKRAKDLAEGLRKFDTQEEPDRQVLRQCFIQSGQRIAVFLSDLLAGADNRRGFKKGVFTTLAYFISHESHHRGSILLTLKQSGKKLDQQTQYAIWDWDRI